MDWPVILAWILSIGLPILLAGLLIAAIRHWGWPAFTWLLILGLGGAAATVMAQQLDNGWLFQVVGWVAFPLGLVLPPTLLGFLFYSAIWFGPPLAAIVVPIIYGVGFAVCGMFQVWVVSTIRSRSERRKRFSDRQEEVRRLRDSVNP